VTDAAPAGEAASPAPAAAPPAAAAPRSFIRWLWEWAKSIAVALVIWFVLRALLIEAFRIPSSSMEHTLLVGDFLFVNKALYGAEIPIVHTRLPAIREPQRLDIVVFDSKTQEGVKVVKRLIGMPGDTLEMRHGTLLRNGEAQPEPYIQRIDSLSDPIEPEMKAWQVRYLLPSVDRDDYHPSRDNWGPIVVPAGQYFVMGDNRDTSYDSRYWGFVDRRVIRGRPLFVYYSFDQSSPNRIRFLTAIRWSRLGTAPR
jgi:signal peptidase I